MSKRNSYNVAYHSKQERFGFIQALAVICPLSVNLTLLDAFQLPPTVNILMTRLCVSIDQCGVNVVTVDKVLEKCLYFH